MSDEKVYFKTAAGEAAVRERTRLVQRNLRTVLILVDGLADMAALKNKAGDAAMVEAAVLELERMGLIETQDTQEAGNAGGAPRLTFEIADARPTSDRVEAAPVAEFPFTGGAGALPADTRSESFRHSGWLTKLRQHRQEVREEALYEEAYGRAVDTPAPEPFVPKAAPATAPGLRPKRKLRLGRLALIAALVALVLAVLRVVFYPYDEYRPRFEEALTQVLGDPVSIRNLRVTFLPMPLIVLEKVSIGGTPPYATVDTIRLSPELSSLFGEHRYRQAAVQGLTVSAAGVGRLSRWFKSAGSGKAAVDRMAIENLWFSAGGNSFGPLSGVARIDPARGIDQIQLAGSGPVRVDAVPTPAGLSLTLSASNWLSPLQPPIKFTTLEVKGELGDGGFSMKKLEGLAYDGQFSGQGEISWRDGARLSLPLELRHVAVDKLVGILEGAPLLVGDVDAKLRITSHADSLPRLINNLHTEGSFTVARGQLKHIDLAEALKLGAQRPPGVARGGTTGFEELAGSFSSDERAVRLTGMRMASGLMHASGAATLSRGTEPSINGAASVVINGSASVAALVAISGSARDPELKASR